MTQTELNALMQLLQRIPVSQAEAMWLQALVARLQAEIQAKEKPTALPLIDDDSLPLWIFSKDDDYLDNGTLAQLLLPI